MIGIDTNILLRLVLQDDAAQAAEVRTIMSDALERAEDLYIGPVTLAEVVWTVLAVRKLPRSELAETILAIIETPPFRVFDESVLRQALSLFAAGPAGFTDCLIRAMDQAAGCDSTLTYDRKAQKTPGFVSPPRV